MPTKSKKSGGDFILESKHLVGLFMLLVVIFGVVFTLGYLLGRSQYDTQLRAAVNKVTDDVEGASSQPVAKTKDKADSDNAPSPDSTTKWDFYHSADSKPADDHLQAPAKKIAEKQPVAAPKPAAAPGPVAAAKSAKSLSAPNGPLIPKGAIMLQVAAVTSEGDALALAQALQQKKFPAFVITPTSAPGADKFYRIQVGPYTDNKAAATARQDLEAKGFKSIIKR